MTNNLIQELKALIVEMREEEDYCTARANQEPSKAAHLNGFAGGLCNYRTKLESLIEQNSNSQRPHTIDQEAQ